MKIDKEKIDNITKGAKKVAGNITEKTKSVVSKSKEKVVETIDVNGDARIDIEDVIVMGLRTPGIKIKRDEFLQKELMKNYSPETIAKAIKENPAKAGITVKEINIIADSVIKYERNCVSGISALISAPGNLSMAVSVSADIIQYYGYMLRATQKLMYLYGFPEINVEEKECSFDSETLNILIICLGVMYGVAGANKAIKIMATGLGKGLSKKIMNTALTKGTIYPLAKSIASFFSVKLTKKMVSGIVEKSLPPLVSGAVGGGITYASFKPCCDKLKKSLQDTLLSNPERKITEEEIKMVEDLEKENS